MEHTDLDDDSMPLICPIRNWQSWVWPSTRAPIIILKSMSL